MNKFNDFSILCKQKLVCISYPERPVSILLAKEFHIEKTSYCRTIEHPGSKSEIPNQGSETA
jgi:hypothetical protein